jgi:hypothetical protein
MKTTLFSLAGALVLAISFSACGPTAEGECEDLKESNQGCWNSELSEKCQELHAECPGQIVVMESCPVQLACP